MDASADSCFAAPVAEDAAGARPHQPPAWYLGYQTASATQQPSQPLALAAGRMEVIAAPQTPGAVVRSPFQLPTVRTEGSAFPSPPAAAAAAAAAPQQPQQPLLTSAGDSATGDDIIAAMMRSGRVTVGSNGELLRRHLYRVRREKGGFCGPCNRACGGCCDTGRGCGCCNSNGCCDRRRLEFRRDSGGEEASVWSSRTAIKPRKQRSCC